MAYDYAGLNSRLLAGVRDLLPQWLPGGRVQGREYVCGSLQGGKGSSTSINIYTGAWAEFAGSTEGQRGGDLVSLYGAIRGMSNGAAYRELGGEVMDAAVAVTTLEVVHLGPPPEGADGPPLGGASGSWCYRGADGSVLFYVARYDDGKKKSIRPWSWDTERGRWVAKAWPAPRPLYGLDALAAAGPDVPVLVVEGEKAADAVRALNGPCVVMTWPNGSTGADKADWGPLMGHGSIVLWPDHDAPGRAAMAVIGRVLTAGGCKVSILDPAVLPGGGETPIAWDAADHPWADWDELKAWAGERVKAWVDVAVGAVPLVAGAVPPPSSIDGVALVDVIDPPVLGASVEAIALAHGLALRGRSGQPVVNIDNACRALDKVPGFSGLVYFDTFYGGLRHEVGGATWTDADTLALLVRFQRELGFITLTEAQLYGALSAYGATRARSAPAAWLAGLSWDGQDRLTRFWSDYFGAEDTAYHRSVGKNFFVSMVARITKPGCKVDNMIVIEGIQGAGKSSALELLAGEWYAEASESVNSKDFFMILQGKVLVEVAELDSFNKADVTRIKQIVTCRSDRYRAPYGRLSADYPRTSVLVGTTNEHAYLRDSTGARRFWPVGAARVDFGALGRDREQLWAQAAALYTSGHKWWELPEEEAATVAEERRLVDEVEETVSLWLEDYDKKEVSLRDIWVDALGGTILKFEPREQRRLAKIAQACGWYCKVVKRDGKCVRLYFPKIPF